MVHSVADFFGTEANLVPGINSGKPLSQAPKSNAQAPSSSSPIVAATSGSHPGADSASMGSLIKKFIV